MPLEFNLLRVAPEFLIDQMDFYHSSHINIFTMISVPTNKPTL